MIRRLRRTASAVGLSVGSRPENYDGEARSLRGMMDDDEDEEVNEGMKANGTRVWYR